MLIARGTMTLHCAVRALRIMYGSNPLFTPSMDHLRISQSSPLLFHWRSGRDDTTRGKKYIPSCTRTYILRHIQKNCFNLKKSVSKGSIYLKVTSY